MANPQCEDGFVRIANEILRALMRVNLTAYQRRCLDFILLMTYGYNRKEAELRHRDFVKATGIRRQHVWRAITELQAKNIIVTQSGYKLGKTYWFNKDYEKWEPNEVTKKGEPNEVTKCNLTRLQGEPNEVTNSNNKDNIQIQKTIYGGFAPDTPPAPPEKTTPKPKKKSTRKKPETGWPPNFSLQNGMREYAIKQGYDPDKIDQLFESWRLRCEARGYRYRNWVAAYQTMCRDDWDSHKQYKATEKKVHPWQKGIWAE